MPTWWRRGSIFNRSPTAAVWWPAKSPGRPDGGGATRARFGVAEVAAELRAGAKAAGLAIAELQVDFDAAESKLEGYRAGVTMLRQRTGGTPLVITALPAWLRHDAFRALVHAADGFVLQVHSLEKPAGPDGAFTLCDPERALAWVRQAGAIGVPFRVALPTYGYVTAFTAEGKFLGLAAEGPRPAWPAGTRLRVVRADAGAMARLAQTLAQHPPPSCTGVIWFRLPIASDRLNWDEVTLATVLRGELPRAQLAAEVTWSGRGLAEIAVVNSGTTTEVMPARLTVRWSEAERLIAADGLGGFRLDAQVGEGQATIVAAAVPPDAFLAPGRRAQVAWIRFSHELSLDVRLPEVVPPR
jgi:hypothetical protein